jgi:hypothetical protein
MALLKRLTSLMSQSRIRLPPGAAAPVEGDRIEIEGRLFRVVECGWDEPSGALALGLAAADGGKARLLRAEGEPPGGPSWTWICGGERIDLPASAVVVYPARSFSGNGDWGD